jgi:DNA repair exonuclease SbcCD ATPase subunit
MKLDERTQAELTRGLRKLGVYLGTFVAGGVFAFSYSYYSLHSAKDREIDHLETRLEAGADRLVELEEELTSMRVRIEGQPNREAFDDIQEEFAGATARKEELEGKLDRANRKVRDLEKSQGSWKAKYAKMEESRDDLALELETANASLRATQEMAAEAARPLDASPSLYGTARGQSLASTDAIRVDPGTGDYWEAGSDSRPQTSRPVPAGAPSAAE